MFVGGPRIPDFSERALIKLLMDHSIRPGFISFHLLEPLGLLLVYVECLAQESETQLHDDNFFDSCLRFGLVVYTFLPGSNSRKQEPPVANIDSPRKSRSG